MDPCWSRIQHRCSILVRRNITPPSPRNAPASPGRAAPWVEMPRWIGLASCTPTPQLSRICNRYLAQAHGDAPQSERPQRPARMALTCASTHYPRPCATRRLQLPTSRGRSRPPCRPGRIQSGRSWGGHAGETKPSRRREAFGCKAKLNLSASGSDARS